MPSRSMTPMLIRLSFVVLALLIASVPMVHAAALMDHLPCGLP